MKAHYRFLYKAVAVFLYGIFAMGIGYCGIYLLLSYASPANLPAALSDHTGLLTLGLGFCCLGLLATLTYLMRGAGRRPEAEGFFPGWQEKIPPGSIPPPVDLRPLRHPHAPGPEPAQLDLYRGQPAYRLAWFGRLCPADPGPAYDPGHPVQAGRLVAQYRHLLDLGPMPAGPPLALSEYSGAVRRLACHMAGGAIVWDLPVRRLFNGRHGPV